MRRLRPWWLALPALCAIAALGLSGSEGGAVAPPAAAALPPAPEVRAATPRPRASAAQQEAPAPAEASPGSLAGTEVDGGLEAGADGHLALGPRVIALFDYFFSAAGEEDDAVIRRRIEAYAAAHLIEPALGEALDLLDQYMALRDAARTLRIDGAATAADRLAAMKRLRREHFGEAAEALFGEEERAGDVALQKSRIALDPELSPEEREDLLAEQEARLPEPTRRARAEGSSVTQLRADEQTLREAGADEAEIESFRRGALGAEAADRLGELDRLRAEWKARVAAYRQERDRACGGLADAAACENALLERSFNERERLRVRALTGAP